MPSVPRKTILAYAAGLLLVACHPDDRMPANFGRISLGKKNGCPNVLGRFARTSEPIAHMMAGRFLPYDSTHAAWEWFELTGSPDSAMQVTVQRVDGSVAKGTMRKEGERAGDYQCADGWIVLRDRDLPNTWDSDVLEPDEHPRRRAMRVASTTTGDLVARLDMIDFDEFTVWCGDGCKGIPLPWTFTRRSGWSTARQYDSSEAHPTGTTPDRQQQVPADRLGREEQELENGPPIPGLETVRRRAMAALPPGVTLRGVGQREQGWHVSVEFAELSQLEHFMVQLEQSGNVSEIHVAPLYRGKRPDGRWADVVYVRFRDVP